MAIYHCSIKIISRGSGKSAVAASAYRAGEKIKNDYDGIIHDYTRKSGVVHTEILLPNNAPPEYKDRAVLWNAVEKVERYKTAQLAREIEIALPREFSEVKNRSLVREYVKQNFVDKGMCADIAIHDTGTGNPHAHVLLTMRPIETDGKWGQKSHTINGQKIPTVDWNAQTKAEEWRSAWAEIANKYLEISGVETKLDHRSFKRQGKDELPTIHLGSAAHQMEKRGIHTERGNINREIQITNQRLRQLKARIRKMQDWVNEEIANDKPPTLAEVIQNILAPPEVSDNYFAISKLKSAAQTLNFLTENNIQDVAELDGKFNQMNNRLSAIQQEHRPIERRLKTLDEHIRQSDNYFKHKEIYKEYKALKPRKQAKYYEEHRTAIQLFEYAKKYFDECMNGRTKLPIKEWKDEQKRRTAEKSTLNGEYKKLKSEVDEISKIRNSVYSILGKERKQTQPQKAYKDMNMSERLAWAKKKADEQNASRTAPPIRKKSYEHDR